MLIRRSTGGHCLYETSYAGRQSLYCGSIMWDLCIPQETTTVLYEDDDDGATAMANAGKPTSRTRHIDISRMGIERPGRSQTD
jgi:hypothetical protein